MCNIFMRLTSVPARCGKDDIEHLDRKRDPSINLLSLYRTNPVPAELAKHPRDYPWPSYAYHADGHPRPLVTPHALYQRLTRTTDGRQQAIAPSFITT